MREEREYVFFSFMSQDLHSLSLPFLKNRAHEQIINEKGNP